MDTEERWRDPHNHQHGWPGTAINEVSRTGAAINSAPDNAGLINAEEGVTMDDLRINARFNALRNALYHSARRRSFERLGRIFNFLVIVLGTAAASDILATADVSATYPAIAVAVIGALQLTFDFGGQARTHQSLQKAYFDLLADIDRTIDPSPNEVAEWRSRQSLITADEPPVMRAIDAKAYNDAIAASTDFDGGERLLIPFSHGLLGGFFSFEGYQYRKVFDVGSGNSTS